MDMGMKKSGEMNPKLNGEVSILIWAKFGNDR